MAQEDSDLQKIKKIIEIMKANDLAEVEIKHGDDKILLKRSEPKQPIPIAAAANKAAKEPDTKPPNQQALPLAHPEEELVEIKSPMVGTFYATPSPDSALFVELESHVNPQTVVCIIEAMKVMNEIKAETSGTIAQVMVSNGEAVEYGQVLFKVRPD